MNEPVHYRLASTVNAVDVGDCPMCGFGSYKCVTTIVTGTRRTKDGPSEVSVSRSELRCSRCTNDILRWLEEVDQ